MVPFRRPRRNLTGALDHRGGAAAIPRTSLGLSGNLHIERAASEFALPNVYIPRNTSAALSTIAPVPAAERPCGLRLANGAIADPWSNSRSNT